MVQMETDIFYTGVPDMKSSKYGVLPWKVLCGRCDYKNIPINITVKIVNVLNPGNYFRHLV